MKILLMMLLLLLSSLELCAQKEKSKKPLDPLAEAYFAKAQASAENSKEQRKFERKWYRTRLKQGRPQRIAWAADFLIDKYRAQDDPRRMLRYFNRTARHLERDGAYMYLLRLSKGPEYYYLKERSLKKWYRFNRRCIGYLNKSDATAEYKQMHANILKNNLEWFCWDDPTEVYLNPYQKPGEQAKANEWYADYLRYASDLLLEYEGLTVGYEAASYASRALVHNYRADFAGFHINRWIEMARKSENWTDLAKAQRLKGLMHIPLEQPIEALKAFEEAFFTAAEHLSPQPVRWAIGGAEDLAEDWSESLYGDEVAIKQWQKALSHWQERLDEELEKGPEKGNWASRLADLQARLELWKR